MKVSFKTTVVLTYYFFFCLLISSCATEEIDTIDGSDSEIAPMEIKAQQDCAKIVPYVQYEGSPFATEILYFTTLSGKTLTLNSDGTIRYSSGRNVMQQIKFKKVVGTKYFAVQARNGKFLSSEIGRKAATFSRNCVGEWEQFERVIANEGRCGCSSRTGFYLKDKTTGKCFNSKTNRFDTPFRDRGKDNFLDTN